MSPMYLTVTTRVLDVPWSAALAKGIAGNSSAALEPQILLRHKASLQKGTLLQLVSEVTALASSPQMCAFPFVNGSELICSFPLRFILKLVCEDTSGFFKNHFIKFLHSLLLNRPPLNFTLMEYYIQCQKLCGKCTSPSSYLPFIFTFILSKATQVTDKNFLSVICNIHCKSTES